MRNCRSCGTSLVIGENVTQHRLDTSDYICRICRADQAREYYHHNIQRRQRNNEYNHRTGRHKPLGANKECPLYLGVHVAERVLGHVFKNVERMPVTNPGHDFVCNRGKKVDVKSSCMSKEGKWAFDIRHNATADFFLCLAFDNREDLNPLHIWLIPGNKLNHLIHATIRLGTIHKWDEYRLDISKIITCCDTIRGSCR